MSLNDYLLGADALKAARLVHQWSEAVKSATVTCACGQKRALTMAYRCLYCGEWYCVTCAEVHFGQTIKGWIEEKRIAKRAEIEARRAKP